MPLCRIRRGTAEDWPLLVTLWERSVRATHHFVSEAEIAGYRPLVAGMFAAGSLEVWVATGDSDVPIGFLGLSAHAIGALFLDPACRRRGIGRQLIAHAQRCIAGALEVDVNEENVDALAFYQALGFEVVGRSPLDDTGRPHPVLHLRRKAQG
jgi:putative acetyltransferase